MGYSMSQMLWVCALYMMDSLCSHMVLGFYLFAVLDEKLCWKKMGKFVLLAGSFPGIFGGLGGLFMPGQVLLFYVLSTVIVFSIATFVVSRLWNRDLWRAFCLVGISAILQVSNAAVVGSIVQSITLEQLADFLLFAQQMFLLYPLTAWGISSLLKKLHFGRPIQYLLEDGRHIRRTAVVVLLLEITVEVFFTQRMMLNNKLLFTYNAAVIILTLLLLCLIMYLARREESTRKIQLQESMILQQQMYVENLEEMQREMRIFRHDYKNMLSGMYLYAQEGEVGKIQKTLEKLEMDFDQKIGEKIYATTQMGNIRIPEVKGLVMSKLVKMNELGIPCRLEAFYPIVEIGMDVWDFNRCLGILLDNAIEAAQESGQPGVELLLMSQGGFLTVRVANPWEGEIDITRIWEEGYSTKGGERGLGLSSCRKILEKYPGAVLVTSCENKTFVQELTL